MCCEIPRFRVFEWMGRSEAHMVNPYLDWINPMGLVQVADSPYSKLQTKFTWKRKGPKPSAKHNLCLFLSPFQ